MDKIIKILTASVCLIFLGIPCFSLTLEGGVVYTVERAREEAFKGVQYKISMKPYEKYFNDPGFISAPVKEGGRPKVNKKGRFLTYFSNGEYCITYYTDMEHCYYYDLNGKLIAIQIHKSGYVYPLLESKYDTKGKLIELCYYLNSKDSYLFDVNKNLLEHWIKNRGYNAHGELIMTRKSRSFY